MAHYSQTTIIPLLSLISLILLGYNAGLATLKLNESATMSSFLPLNLEWNQQGTYECNKEDECYYTWNWTIFYKGQIWWHIQGLGINASSNCPIWFLKWFITWITNFGSCTFSIMKSKNWFRMKTWRTT
jgi:hypothetical protein